MGQGAPAWVGKIGPGWQPVGHLQAFPAILGLASTYAQCWGGQALWSRLQGEGISASSPTLPGGLLLIFSSSLKTLLPQGGILQVGKIFLYFMAPFNTSHFWKFSTHFFVLFYCSKNIQHEISLNNILSVQYGIVDYRYNYVQISGAHLPRTTETLCPKVSNPPHTSPLSPWQPSLYSLILWIWLL